MKNKIVQGTLKTNPRGFGFVCCLDKKTKDVFIPKSEMKNAIDGDIVEVQIKNITSKGLDGTILKIVKREKTHLAGIIWSKTAKKNHYEVYVPLLGTDWSVIVKTDKIVKHGDRIIMEVIKWEDKKETTICKMTKHLSHISDVSKDTEASIAEFNIAENFTKEEIEQAQNLKITREDLEKRKDLSNLITFTIDPIGAKDFDDAASISKDENGNFNLAVHVTDVAHFIKPNTHLDKVAAKRANSTYFPDRCVPMLPYELSSDLCSLKENEIRLTISVLMIFDKSGDLLNYEIARSFIKSEKRFTYEEAKEVLDSKKSHKYKKNLKDMVELCLLLKKQRFTRGSIDFALPDSRLILDKDKSPIKIETVEYDITHQLIEEFMLKANEIVATHLSKKGRNLIYRIHEEPNFEDFKDFFEIARSLGFKLPKSPTHTDIQNLFLEAKDSKYLHLLSIAFIKNLRLACYSPDNIGHFGLALKHYTHFTSPIRRYTDLITQRILFDEEDKTINLNEIAQICSEKERLSFKAESSLITLKKLRFLKKILKKEANKKFVATVTKVKPFGIYFELENYFVDGFLHVSEIGDDYYEYFEEALQLVGTHSHKTFSFAKKIKVKILDIDLIFLEIKYKFVKR
ncbi:MAG: Ribonuclease R [Candidatus Anoxychlamydiales bacterium]|nr:Ribonuclease R [Candidatus Anoxychlamydiales bacterium]